MSGKKLSGKDLRGLGCPEERMYKYRMELALEMKNTINQNLIWFIKNLFR